MNSKSVLSKILTILSLNDGEVKFTDAQTKDGTILQSPTFDVGETVEVVSEDGTKSPAPDGEHEIVLKDTEGNEVPIKVITKDGKIVERENVELEKPKEEVVDKEAEVKDEADVKMADATTEEAHPLPMTTDEDPRNLIPADTDEEKDPLITLAYRIAEMEKAMDEIKTKMADMSPVSEEAVTEEEPEAEGEEVAMAAEDDEEVLPKLDGAPLDSVSKFASETKFGKKPHDAQSTFLSKLYK